MLNPISMACHMYASQNKRRKKRRTERKEITHGKCEVRECLLMSQLKRVLLEFRNGLLRKINAKQTVLELRHNFTKVLRWEAVIKLEPFQISLFWLGRKSDYGSRVPELLWGLHRISMDAAVSHMDFFFISFSFFALAWAHVSLCDPEVC